MKGLLLVCGVFVVLNVGFAFRLFPNPIWILNAGSALLNLGVILNALYR